MKYKVKDVEVDLPLTVEAIEDYIKQCKSTPILQDDLTNQMAQLMMKTILFRDVLICISSGASHYKELAKAALKMEYTKLE